MTFDPATVEELAGSPRLPAMRSLFQAIAAGKSAQEVWRMTGKVTTDLNAIERSRIPDLVRAALQERDREHN
jgi:hypothetical protein